MLKTVLFNKIFPGSLLTDEGCDCFPCIVLIHAMFPHCLSSWLSTVSGSFSISTAVLT